MKAASKSGTNTVADAIVGEGVQLADRGEGQVRLAYSTALGEMFLGRLEELLTSPKFLQRYSGAIQLIFTSPPFPLNTKKRYGNLTGNKYLEWLERLAPSLRSLLTKDGSLVVEMGNAWERGQPTMSTLPLRALLAIHEAGPFHLCQQFICHNPARLPSPIQWVNVERVRVKDSFTHLWWFSASPRPKADNRKVLRPYSRSMQRLLNTKKYNAGRRPSQYKIGEKSFLADNNGAIPPSVLSISNTATNDEYQKVSRRLGRKGHPARMPEGLAEFFIKFLTTERDIVFDPFSGSNTTGSVAEKLNRRWVGVEARDEYVTDSRVRFDRVCEHIPFAGTSEQTD